MLPLLPQQLTLPASISFLDLAPLASSLGYSDDWKSHGLWDFTGRREGTIYSGWLCLRKVPEHVLEEIYRQYIFAQHT